MIWYFRYSLAIAANIIFAMGHINATQPMELNSRAMASVFDLFPWAIARLENGLKTVNNRMETGQKEASQNRPKANDFCSPEFEPLPVNQLSELPDNRSIEQVEKSLGQPCETDSDNIYYVLTTGEIVYFNKSTGKGGFQG